MPELDKSHAPKEHTPTRARTAFARNLGTQELPQSTCTMKVCSLLV
jgi:hypothetical protein